MKKPAVYIVSNRNRNVLYVGVTSDIARRAHQHKTGLLDGYTKRYQCRDLIYYEAYPTMEEAITREKQIKRWSRAKKDTLVSRFNPELKDLYDVLL